MRISKAIILLTAIVLGGCNGAEDANVNSNANSNANSNKSLSLEPPKPIKPVEAVDPTFKACNTYFPLVPGSITKYVLNYSSGLVADVTVIVDSGEEGGRKVYTQRSQIVDRSGGMQITQLTVRKFACDGERVQILSERTESNIAGEKSSVDFKFRENALMMSDPQTVSRKGATWQHVFTQVFSRPGEPLTPNDTPTFINFEVIGPEQVTTPVGSFKAVKIVRKIGENLTTDFYAAGIGLISRINKDGTKLELREYSGLKPTD